MKGSTELSVLWLVLPHSGYDAALTDFSELWIRLLTIFILTEIRRWVSPEQNLSNPCTKMKMLGNFIKYRAKPRSY